MPRQAHHARFEASLDTVFSALLVALARRRWAEGRVGAAFDSAPRAGTQYVNERGSLVRRGRVIECLRPVSLTLYETLFDTPCRVRLKLRWRLEPIDAGCLLRLEVRYVLNTAAGLRRSHWGRQIREHGARMLVFVHRELARARTAQGEVGSTGQSHGSNSMVTTKTTAVSGRPSLR